MHQQYAMGSALLLLLVLTPLQLDGLPVVEHDQHPPASVTAPFHLSPSLSLLYLAYPWKYARSLRSPYASFSKRSSEMAAPKRSWWPKRCFDYIFNSRDTKIKNSWPGPQQGQEPAFSTTWPSTVTSKMQLVSWGVKNFRNQNILCSKKAFDVDIVHWLIMAFFHRCSTWSVLLGRFRFPRKARRSNKLWVMASRPVEFVATINGNACSDNDK